MRNKRELTRRTAIALGIGGLATFSGYTIVKRGGTGGQSPNSVTSMSFSSCGKLLCFARGDGTIRLFDPAANREVGKIGGSAGTSISHLRIHDDDSWILSANGSSGTLQFWSLPEIQHSSHVILDARPTAFAFRPRRRSGVTPSPASAVVASADGKLSLYETGTMAALATGHGPGFVETFRYVDQRSKISSIAYSRAGDALVAGSTEGVVRVHRHPDLSVIFELKAPAPVNSIAISSDSRKIVAGLENGQVVGWRHNGKSFKHIASSDSANRAVCSVAFCGSRVVAASATGSVKVFSDIDALSSFIELEKSPSIRPLVASSASGDFIGVSWGDSVKVFNKAELI